MKRIMSLCLMMALLTGNLMLYGQNAEKKESTENKGVAQAAVMAAPSNDPSDTPRVKIARLRGRLLYKKNQIRKLEKGACASNEALLAKVSSLEQEKRSQYLSVEPKLKPLYEEQDALELEIKKLEEEK